MTAMVAARAVPPGRLIRREIEERGWTQRELAQIMGRPEHTITDIVRGSKQITPETAQDLAAAFGTSAQVWLNLESNYRLALAARETAERTTTIERRARLHTIVPIKELVKRGWVAASDNLTELEQRVCAFLGVDSLDAVALPSVSFRQAQGRDVDIGAQLAWLRRAEALARAQSVAPFTHEGLMEHISDILAHAAHSEDVVKVPDTLRKLGVHCVLVPNLPHTFVDGAAFWVGEYPAVALSLRHDRIDNFWMTLMHELAHITTGRKKTHIDQFDDEDAATNTASESFEEHEADERARNWLVNSVALAGFVRDAGPTFSAGAVRDFAKSQGRTPGIILGCLYKDKLLGYDRHRFMIGKVRSYLEPWLDVSEPATKHEKNMDVGAVGERTRFTFVWAAIERNAGQQFFTKTGRPFTYEMQGTSVKLHQTARLIPQSDFEYAFQRMPIPGPGSINNRVQGPAYAWAILHDPRIAGPQAPTASPSVSTSTAGRREPANMVGTVNDTAKP